MVGVVVALESEARPLADKYNLMRIVEKGRIFYSGDKMLIAVSGVGKVNAQIATGFLIGLGVSLIVNVGSCASLKLPYKIGQLVTPNLFFDGDFDMSEDDISTKDPALVNRAEVKEPVECYSYSTFNVDNRALQGIVDMEAYGVVAQAVAMEIPYRVIKVVSSSENNQEVATNLDILIRNKIGEICKIIEEVRDQYESRS